MKVLDSTFLIDYLSGVDATAEFLLGHEDEVFVTAAPALAEVLVGEGNDPEGDVTEARARLAWLDVHPVREETAVTAGELAAMIGPQGPALSGMDGIIGALAFTSNAEVVSRDGDFTHPETQKVLDVKEY